jgi:tRNA1Val (adenine37-N6)-methyltransferase
MANSYFQFKQFIVHQDRCAMKVGTDGVLLGAWTTIGEAQHILDIGTGTGLIALMLAQRSGAKIDAIEIDEAAARQASENVQLSPWNDRIRIIHTSLQEYTVFEKHYDLIVTNPPYFYNSLPATDFRRTIARHTHYLDFEMLIQAVKNLLTPDGRLAIILPTENFSSFASGAYKSGLFTIRETHVKPSPGKPVKRILAEFSFYDAAKEFSEFIIEEFGRHGYSEEYHLLTKDFYLSL